MLKRSRTEAETEDTSDNVPTRLEATFQADDPPIDKHALTVRLSLFPAGCTRALYQRRMGRLRCMDTTPGASALVPSGATRFSCRAITSTQQPRRGSNMAPAHASMLGHVGMPNSFSIFSWHGTEHSPTRQQL